MRIAVVYDCLYPLSVGGGELLYRTFSERFAELGHEVSYLTRAQWTGAAPELPGIWVEAIAGPVSQYDDDGVRRVGPAVGFAVGIARHLLRHRSRYDVVWVSALPAINVLAARAALAGSRTRLCADFLEVWRPDQWLEYSGSIVGRIAGLVQWLAVRVAPLASAHAELTAQRLRAAGLATAPVRSPGLIPADLVGRPALDVVEPPTVVFAGRLIPDKRAEAIPAAVAWVRDQGVDLRARIFGDGGQRDAVRAEIDRLELGSVIELPGFVDAEQLAEAMSTASALVQPSRREGYGIVVVEAGSTGTPSVLVAAADNAAVELVRTGRNGVVADSTDPAVLGAAILEVVRAGAPLRVATFAWFSAAMRTQTMVVAADRLLAAFSRADR